MTQAKTALRGILLGVVPGIGTIDLARLDPDDVPRALKQTDTRVNTDPYWSLALASVRDREGPFGQGAAAPTVFRTYVLRLEGWRGIQAATDAQDAWDTLIEAILDALELANPEMARAVPGFLKFQRPGAGAIDIVKLTEHTRAHHAIIDSELLVYKSLS